MDWKLIGRLWLVGLAIFILGCMIIGCGASRWSPTDPRTEGLDTSQIVTESEWEMDIDVDVQP